MALNHVFNLCVTDRRTNERTEGRHDYSLLKRDARTHLKKQKYQFRVVLNVKFKVTLRKLKTSVKGHVRGDTDNKEGSKTQPDGFNDLFTSLSCTLYHRCYDSVSELIIRFSWIFFRFFHYGSFVQYIGSFKKKCQQNCLSVFAGL